MAWLTAPPAAAAALAAPSRREPQNLHRYGVSLTKYKAPSQSGCLSPFRTLAVAKSVSQFELFLQETHTRNATTYSRTWPVLLLASCYEL